MARMAALDDRMSRAREGPSHSSISYEGPSTTLLVGTLSRRLGSSGASFFAFGSSWLDEN